MDNITSFLKTWQANTVVLYSTAHGFHWNVEGPLFKQYHAFFKEIYEDVYSTVDTVSEWLRKFGEVAPYTLLEFTANNNYGDVQLDSNSPVAMSRQLLAMNNKMIMDIESAMALPEMQKQQGLLNFLAERQDQHQFWAWELKSSITPTVN